MSRIVRSRCLRLNRPPAIIAAVGDWGGSCSGDTGAQRIAFESFDVRIRVTVDGPGLLERVLALLPPHSKPCPVEDVIESFGIFLEPDGRYRFERGDSAVSTRLDLPLALQLMEAQLRICVGMHTPGRLFIHAGVVESRGSALVMPGSSFSGKTTLVAALVEAGARYYSDDYAVIDEDGLVHPFAKPLSIRDQQQVQNVHPVERLGGSAGVDPVPIGAVVFTAYRPGARWQPVRLSHGRGVLAMLEHTLPARERAGEAFAVFKRAIQGAALLEGDRGEAAELADWLLETPADQLGLTVVTNGAR